MNIILVCICVAMVGGATLRRRSTGVTPPCFLDDTGDISTDQSLLPLVQKVKVQIDTFKAHSENLKHQMYIEYCIKQEAQKESTEHMNLSQMNVDVERPTFEHNFHYNTTLFLEKMRSHFDTLNQLANYFEELNKTAKDQKAMANLTSIQTDIYNCMCEMKIGLISHHQDPMVVVPNGDLSDKFMQSRKGYIRTCNQHTSEYATVLNSQRIATYLEKMYSFFDETSAPVVG